MTASLAPSSGSSTAPWTATAGGGLVAEAKLKEASDVIARLVRS